MKLIHLPPDGTYGARIVDVHAIFCVEENRLKEQTQGFIVTSNRGGWVDISPGQMDLLLPYLGAEKVEIPPSKEAVEAVDALRNFLSVIRPELGAEKVAIPPAPENAKTETGAEILFPMG